MAPKTNKAAAKSGKAAPSKAQKQKEDRELEQLQTLAAAAYTTSHESKAEKDSRQKQEKLTQALAAQQQQQMANHRQPTEAEFRAMLQMRQEEARLAIAAAQYVNVLAPLPEDKTSWFELAPGKFLRYEQFTPAMLQPVVDLFTAELSEPYSAFTYQYFLATWPDLAIIAYGVEAAAKPGKDVAGDMIGCVVSKVSRKGPGAPLRGYIAMLAVKQLFRGHRIGQKMVVETVQLMKQKEVLEVGLETPISNAHALKLYTTLGFVKTKFLARYYLDGSDAVRLKLWLQSPFAASALAAKAAAGQKEITNGNEEGATTAQQAVAPQ